VADFGRRRGGQSAALWSSRTQCKECGNCDLAVKMGEGKVGRGVGCFL
jgi:hypothetical protein